MSEQKLPKKNFKTNENEMLFAPLETLFLILTSLLTHLLNY